MPSPPRPLRHSPPRKPLHNRSDSSTNERASPTVRIVGDPHATIYSSTPFPTHPSHILSPKTTRPSGVVLEEVGVSDQQCPTFPENVSENVPIEGVRTTTAKGKEVENSEDPNNRSSPWPRPLRNSQHLSPTANVSQDDGDFEADDRSFIVNQALNEGRSSEEIVQLPSVDSRSDALGSNLLMSNQTSYQQPVAAKSSDGSLSSAESTGTVIRTKPRDRPTRAFCSAFPSPNRQNNNIANLSSVSLSTPVNPNLRTSQVEASPVYSVPPKSPAASSYQLVNSHRAVSVACSDLEGDVNVQYPVIRPPSAQESWAESSEPTSRGPPARNPNRARWNPHLSTVESVGMTDRSSGSLFTAESSRNSPKAPNSRSETPPLPAFPLSAYPARRDTTTSTIRVVNEQHDYVSSNLAPIPGSRGSTRLSILSGSSGGGNRRSGLLHSTRPSSRGSFFRDSIPAWARTYYGRGGRNSMLPQNYSTDNVQGSDIGTEPYSTDYSTAAHTDDPSASETSLEVLGIHPPRTPHYDHIGHSRNDSLPIARVRPSEINLVEVRGVPRTRVSSTWSPRLWQHRASVPKRRSLFIAPAIDQDAISRSPKRRNIQVILFTIGFIFPLAWFAAAVLPLPPRPAIDEKGKGSIRPASGTSIAQDLENRLAPMDEAQYENARWWRNLNRLMMIVGVLVIAAIITLAVVATHAKQ